MGGSGLSQEKVACDKNYTVGYSYRKSEKAKVNKINQKR